MFSPFIPLSRAQAPRSEEAALEKRAGTLMLVGLGPMSRPGFVIRATDAGLDVTNHTGRDLPFDPAYILADVQRVDQLARAIARRLAETTDVRT